MMQFSARASSSVSLGQAPAAQWSRFRVSERASGFIFWTFVLFFIFSLANVGGLITRKQEQEIPINPVAFAVMVVLIATGTRPKKTQGYFVAAWVFVASYGALGFLGPYAMNGVTPYVLAQLIIKLWIGLIGLPWITIRAVDQSRLATVVKISSIVVALGAVLSVTQMFVPDYFGTFVREKGRGAGFWIDPNSCASICGQFFFFLLLFPFRKRWFNWTILGTLVVGVLSTLSRGGLLELIVGAMVFGLVTKRFKTLFYVCIGLASLALAGTLFLTLVDSKSEHQQKRLDRVMAIFRGDLSDNASGRTVLWGLAFEEVKKEWLFGRGHGGMIRVVPIGRGIGPHNYYLYVWGTSGILVLLAFIWLLISMARMGLRCGDTKAKAVLCASVAALAAQAMTDHSFPAHQYMGPVFGIFVCISHYFRENKAVRGASIPRAAVLPVGDPRRRHA